MKKPWQKRIRLLHAAKDTLVKAIFSSIVNLSYCSCETLRLLKYTRMVKSVTEEEFPILEIVAPKWSHSKNKQSTDHTSYYSIWTVKTNMMNLPICNFFFLWCNHSNMINNNDISNESTAQNDSGWSIMVAMEEGCLRGGAGGSTVEAWRKKMCVRVRVRVRVQQKLVWVQCSIIISIVQFNVAQHTALMRSTSTMHPQMLSNALDSILKLVYHRTLPFFRVCMF